MKIENFLEWPTNSRDPAVNITVALILFVLVLIALFVGAIVAVPIVALILIAKGVHWYLTAPVPTDRLLMEAKQRTTIANFPSRDDFLRAHLHRLLETCAGEYPSVNV